MGGGAAGGLWRHQQWSPTWIFPRSRNQVKIAIQVYPRTYKVAQAHMVLPSPPPPHSEVFRNSSFTQLKRWSVTMVMRYDVISSRWSSHLWVKTHVFFHFSRQNLWIKWDKVLISVLFWLFYMWSTKNTIWITKQLWLKTNCFLSYCT